MVDKIKMDVNRQLLVYKISKNAILTKSNRHFFLPSKTKIDYPTLIFIFYTISQILKTISFVFGK